MTRVRLTIVFLILSAVAAEVLAAEEPRVCAEADREAMNIGDRLEYTLEVVAPKGMEVELPKFSDQKIGDFEIKDFSKKARTSIFGKRVTTKHYYVTIYALGEWAIPAVEVRYKARLAKEWSSKKAEPIRIQVESVLPQGARNLDIKDIKGPLAPYSPNWPLIITILAVLASAGLAIFVYRKLRSRKPAKLPHETALEELENIKSAYAKTGDVKDFFVRISDCIRLYIERRFSLKAPEMTTDEFLESLKDSRELKFEHRDLLKDFLASCDLVKFAKHSPPTEEVEAAYTSARNFVEETKEISKIIEKTR